MELQLHHTINFDKGCYLGQEQVSSMHDNKLGPHRTLHSIIFHDGMNGDEQPRVGDILKVLESNQTIQVG